MKKDTFNKFLETKINEVLDKISKYGIDSLTILEKDFIDSYSNGSEDIIQRLELLENAAIYEDSNFKFELKETKIMLDEIYYIGTLYVPDIVFDNGVRVDGNLDGKIICFTNGTYALEFDKKLIIKKKKIVYEVYDFCWGLEYELDNFIDYIIQELG